MDSGKSQRDASSSYSSSSGIWQSAGEKLLLKQHSWRKLAIFFSSVQHCALLLSVGGRRVPSPFSVFSGVFRCCWGRKCGKRQKSAVYRGNLNADPKCFMSKMPGRSKYVEPWGHIISQKRHHQEMPSLHFSTIFVGKSGAACAFQISRRQEKLIKSYSSAKKSFFFRLLDSFIPHSAIVSFPPFFAAVWRRSRPFDDDNGIGRNKKTKKESKKETRKKTTFSSFWFLTADQSLIFESLGVWRSSFTIFQTSQI